MRIPRALCNEASLVIGRLSIQLCHLPNFSELFTDTRRHIGVWFTVNQLQETAKSTRVCLTPIREEEVMAPRRHANGHAGVLMENGGGGAGGGGIHDTMENNLLTQNQTTRCCTPTGECLRGDALIRLNALHDTVKVTCNNDSCPVGQFMHRECFDAWEQTVLTYLKSCGRARSWSERQRHQNLWTKKGYDLAFKACGCRCGRGHLKKDLDWMPPGTGNAPGNRQDENEAKKKKRRNRQNTRPTLAVSAGPPSHGNHVSTNGRGTTEAQLIESGRGRAGSLSSSTGSSSPPATSEPSVSPLHQPQVMMKKKSKVDFFSDRARKSNIIECLDDGIQIFDVITILVGRIKAENYSLLDSQKKKLYHLVSYIRVIAYRRRKVFGTRPFENIGGTLKHATHSTTQKFTHELRRKLSENEVIYGTICQNGVRIFSLEKKRQERENTLKV
ncbi:Headcase protein [Apis cerana cerana]|uniref:Headcase protein n=1 Tax=Apis cerana cerana TaxID=94128 RepID=A0A2A3ER00_APICC|nr:Headcase protein [Apis cerana cerana]